MATTATGSLAKLFYVMEPTHGVTPDSPTLKPIRGTSRNVNKTKNLIESQEPGPNRNKTSQRHGFEQSTGSIGAELSMGSFDDLFAVALAGDWQTIGEMTMASEVTAAPGETVVSGQAPNRVRIDLDDANFLGLMVGDLVALNETITQGESLYRVESISEDFIIAQFVRDYDVPAAQSFSAGSLIFPGKRVSQDAIMKTFTLVRRFADVAKFQTTRGVSINTMQMAMQPEQMATATFNVLGTNPGNTMDAVEATGTIAFGEQTTTFPMLSLDGGTWIDDEKSGIVTGLTFTLDNGRTLVANNGSRTSGCVFEGQADLTGTLNVFFNDASIISKFENETETSIAFMLDAPDEEDGFISVVLPRVKLNSVAIDPALSGPIVIPIGFTALADIVTETLISIQVSNA